MGANRIISVEDLSQELSLPPVSQDWGIQFSDPKRLGEFALFYLENASRLARDARYYLYELVVSSANDALVEGLIQDVGDNESLAQFLRYHREDEPDQRVYWTSLAENDTLNEFPIASLLDRRRGTGN